MSWLSSLTTIELHAPICNGHPSYINNPPLAKSITPVCTSKGLSNATNLSTGGEENFVLSSPKTWWKGSSHSWDSHFFHKSDKVGQPSSFMLSYAIAIHLTSTSANGKISRPRMHLKGLSNSMNLSTGGEINLLLSSWKTWWQGSSHSWDRHFLPKPDKVRQPLRLMLSHAMVMHLASTSANDEVPCLHMHLKKLLKTRELDHILWRELALKLPKGLVTSVSQDPPHL